VKAAVVDITFHILAANTVKWYTMTAMFTVFYGIPSRRIFPHVDACSFAYEECAGIKAKGARTVKVFWRRRTIRQPVQPVPSEPIVYEEVELLYARGVQQAARGPQPAKFVDTGEVC